MSIIKKIISISILSIIAQQGVVLGQCFSGALNTGMQYSSVSDCLGNNAQTIHETCTNFCQKNNWSFTPGTGEGCYADPQYIYAHCVCEINKCTNGSCPPFGSACALDCSSGVKSTGKTYSSQSSCLGTNNQQIHETCTNYCQDNNWSFVPGYGEGCWDIDGKITASCVCHTGSCQTVSCPTFGKKCPINYQICPQDGHSVNLAAALSEPTVASCATACTFYDISFGLGCANQGCYIAGNDKDGPCVMQSGSYDYYCYCGEISYK